MTVLRRSKADLVWRSGDVPRRAKAAELVVGDGRALVRSGEGVVELDELGMALWPLLDGLRSAPTLARVLAEQRGEPSLATAVAVRTVLEELAAAGAITWV
jgi:hypothetical protein